MAHVRIQYRASEVFGLLCLLEFVVSRLGLYPYVFWWKSRKVYSMQLAMNEVDKLIMKLCAFAVRRSMQRRWRSSRAKTQCTSNHAHRPSLQPEHRVRASARAHTHDSGTHT